MNMQSHAVFDKLLNFLRVVAKIYLFRDISKDQEPENSALHACANMSFTFSQTYLHAHAHI